MNAAFFTLRMDRVLDRNRVKSGLGVALLHAVLGYALVTGLGFEAMSGVSERLVVFNVTEEPPSPPIEAIRDEAPAKAPEGAASPPNLKSVPSPIVAPPPEIRLDVPPPVVAAPVAGVGSEASAGASDQEGPGTGSGGIGTGTGSGGQGTGSGGGFSRKAKWRSGRIVNADYPKAAWRARIEGSVVARLSVGANGRVTGCTVTSSSGNADLDSTTCRLIERRFRYEPARDGQGRPIASAMGWKQDWWLD